jgi:hypothetical protein
MVPEIGNNKQLSIYDPAGNNNVHVDQVLSNISVGWPNGELIGDQLLPSVPVSFPTGKYSIFGRESWALEPGTDLRGPGAEAVEIPGRARSFDFYYAAEHALKIGVTDEEYQVADAPLSPEADAVELVTDKILLARELAIKTLVTTAANYPGTLTTTLTTTASGTSWDSGNYATSDPIKNVKDGFRAMHAQTFIRPNLGVFPFQVMSQLEDHPDFIARIQYTTGGAVTQDIMKTLFGFNGKILVPGLGYNSANMGQAASVGYLWGKDVWFGYVPPKAGLNIPAFGYEFVHKYPTTGLTQETTRWREMSRKRNMFQVGRRYDLKLVALDSNGKSVAGYLIKSAVV